ncbi:MAG: response regulator, partial [Armatimonadetes bacterium]|nr:response regulator [Armatimonadota bacterium]
MDPGERAAMAWGPFPPLRARLFLLILLVALPVVGLAFHSGRLFGLGVATLLAVAGAWLASDRLVLRQMRSLIDGSAAARGQAEEDRLARAAADRANQAKSEFVSRLSHELRTPLNAILGFAQLLEMDALSPEQQEHVVQILKGGRHLLGLIGEALDFARIDAGRLAISPEPVAVKELLQESADLIAPLAAAAGLRIAGDWAATPERFVQADRQRLKQVLLNLLSNAVKYNRPAGVVTLAYRDDGPGRLRIAVTDTGPGIPAERAARLFMPFERLGAEARQIEGTGLGLALSRRLVDLMGGALGVESIPGEGSTFWVALPLTEAPLDGFERTGAEPQEPAGVRRPTRVRTVLYVEDNLSSLRLVQRLLARRPGIRLMPAIQGRLAMDLAREHRPDLIVLDLHLPDMPGEEVLRALKEDPQTR